MVALLEPVARPARAAREAVGERGLAQQRLGKRPGQGGLSESGPAMDEQRVRKGTSPPNELLPRL